MEHVFKRKQHYSALHAICIRASMMFCNFRFLVITMVSVAAVLLVAHPVRGWEGKQDNKSVAELELMNERELFEETHHLASQLPLNAVLHKPRACPI